MIPKDKVMELIDKTYNDLVDRYPEKDNELAEILWADLSYEIKHFN